MEEMMEETMDGLDDDELEDEADEEVDKVLFQLTDGKLGQAGAVGSELPVSSFMHLSLALTLQAKQAEEDLESEAEVQRMQKELQDLLSS